ncbi:hypothetical protein B0T19DRAFT_251379 [Cercophora scortea]|uniref:Uncharacterized protein n=1 Tax=Cercophora scortea TaxID=314031 RepID=A0AAE0M6Z5_9PEZI|nr:hypothetical protein B0T19DRAFT_251379 [Cercophora scortea]
MEWMACLVLGAWREAGWLAGGHGGRRAAAASQGQGVGQSRSRRMSSSGSGSGSSRAQLWLRFPFTSALLRQMHQHQHQHQHQQQCYKRNQLQQGFRRQNAVRCLLCQSWPRESCWSTVGPRVKKGATGLLPWNLGLARQDQDPTVSDEEERGRRNDVLRDGKMQ